MESNKCSLCPDLDKPQNELRNDLAVRHETGHEQIRHESVSAHTAAVLLAAAERVKKEAGRFDMNYWIRQTDITDPSKWLREQAFTLKAFETVRRFKEFHSQCGTSCCLASFILETAPPEFLENFDTAYIEHAAAEFAQLSDLDSLYLFRLGFWPEEFAQAYDKAATPEEAVDALEARVEHFIRTGE